MKNTEKDKLIKVLASNMSGHNLCSVLAVIDCYKKGITHKEVGERYNVSPQYSSKRLTALKDVGLVVGFRVKGVEKSWAITKLGQKIIKWYDEMPT
jgi:predicted transcriptional regulator